MITKYDQRLLQGLSSLRLHISDTNFGYNCTKMSFISIKQPAGGTQNGSRTFIYDALWNCFSSFHVEIIATLIRLNLFDRKITSYMYKINAKQVQKV